MEDLKYINGNKNRPYPTPELKDKLLKLLVERLMINNHNSINKKPLQDYMSGIDIDLIGGMLSTFEDDGLITQLIESNIMYELTLKERGVNHKRLGGYTAKENLFKDHLIRLQKQIKELEDKKILDKSTKIAGTVASLTQLAFQIFK